MSRRERIGDDSRPEVGALFAPGVDPVERLPLQDLRRCELAEQVPDARIPEREAELQEEPPPSVT